MPALPPTLRRHERRQAAIRLLVEGTSQSAVARVLGVSREAVRRWHDAYKLGGLAALAPSPGKRGPKPELSEAECRELMSAAAGQDAAGTISGVLRVARGMGWQLSRSALRRRLVEFSLWP